MSNILFTLFSFSSHFLIHFALSIFLLNFSTKIFYKSSPFANLHINTLDYLRSSYFITYWFIFIEDDSNIWKISWLFSHRLSICSWMSVTRYDYDDETCEMFFPLIVWVKRFSLPDGLRMRSFDWIFLAISFCNVEIGWVSNFLSLSVNVCGSSSFDRIVNYLLYFLWYVRWFLTDGNLPVVVLLIA